LIRSQSDRRRFNFAGVAIVIALLGYAYFAQYVQGYEPCPLCWFQRYAMVLVGAVFLIAGLHAPRGSGARVYAVLGALSALLGAAIAGWHVYIQYTPNPPACSAPFEILWQNRDSVFAFLERVFLEAGDCADIDWSFLWLSMPTWVLLWFLALGGLAVCANWRNLVSDT
jgi:disulfide bond formation protein DsbB